MNTVHWQIRPFTSSDQAATQALILAGLAERWGWLDPTCNPDLDDIEASYTTGGGCFLVVEDEKGAIIGAGGLRLEAPGIGRIVRVSVAVAQRGRGLGRAITQRLIAEGQTRGCHTLLVETNEEWYSAIHLYVACGFVPYARQGEEVHMRLKLQTGGER